MGGEGRGTKEGKGRRDGGTESRRSERGKEGARERERGIGGSDFERREERKRGRNGDRVGEEGGEKGGQGRSRLLTCA